MVLERLFVYGTLMQGESRHAVLLRGRAVRGRAAWVAGRLLDLGAFPGLVDGRGRVAGELIEAESLAGLLPVLDEVEGSRFRRVKREVETAAGAVEAWVYLWAGPRGAGRVIASGDWRRR